jgi:hypothetical protein
MSDEPIGRQEARRLLRKAGIDPDKSSHVNRLARLPKARAKHDIARRVNRSE